MSHIIAVLKLNSKENHISKNLKILLIIHLLFMIGTCLSNIFINVFIWKITNDFKTVINFNIIACIFIATTYTAGGWLSKKKGLRINLIIGMIIYTLFYLIVFTLKSGIIPYLFLLGILRGAGAGFYYVAFNVLGYDYSTNENRDYFLGIMGLNNNFVSMLAPFISGYIISSYDSNLGYQIIFVVSLILFSIGSLISFMLPNKYTKSKFHIVESLIKPIEDKKWGRIMFSELFRGFRDVTVMLVIINVLIYILASQEIVVGNYSLWTSLAATFTCYIVGIFMNSKTRVNYLFVGTVVTAAIGSIFFFKIDMMTLWIFGIISSISINLLGIPQNSICFAVINSSSSSKSRRIEAIVVKEIYLNIGRIISFMLFIPVTANFQLIPYYIFGISLLQISVWLLLRGFDTSRKKKQIAPPILEHEQNLLGRSCLYHIANGCNRVH